MITKNNNFLVKSLTKNLVTPKVLDNRDAQPKKTGNIYVKLNSTPNPQDFQQQQNVLRVQTEKKQFQQRVFQQQEQQRFIEQQEQYRIFQQQQEQQRILQEKQERERIFQQQQQEQQRIFQEKQEQQRLILQRQEEQRILQQHNERQKIIQQQQEQERILKQRQERDRIIREQQEQQRVFREQQEQDRILRQQQERDGILRQQQERDRILREQQERDRTIREQQQEQDRIVREQEMFANKQKLEQQEKQNASQQNVNIPMFAKKKKANEKSNIVTTTPQVQPTNNISSFSSALSDYKMKKKSNNKSGMDIIRNVADETAKDAFQDMCLLNAKLIPNDLLQNIHQGRENEAILIEFRILPHIEFILKNAIVKLGDSFSHTIVCGNVNYLMMKGICDDISPNIKIINLDKNKININDYNNLFYDLSFWELFQGNKLLFYQEDTVIFKNNIQDFLQYDYVGAPWSLEIKHPKFPCVGNGGFSLRNRIVMMDIVREKREIDEVSSTINKKHKSGMTMDNIPEDLFFSVSLLRYNIGNVPDATVASYFSTENIVNRDSLGGHQFWENDRSWSDRMNVLFQEYRR
jgi:hypothetical protein